MPSLCPHIFSLFCRNNFSKAIFFPFSLFYYKHRMLYGTHTTIYFALTKDPLHQHINNFHYFILYFGACCSHMCIFVVAGVVGLAFILWGITPLNATLLFFQFALLIGNGNTIFTISKRSFTLTATLNLFTTVLFVVLSPQINHSIHIASAIAKVLCYGKTSIIISNPTLKVTR